MSRPRQSSPRLAAVTTDKDAIAYDTHVVPRYSALFGRLLLAEIPTDERPTVLDVACGTGYPATEILRLLGDGGRVIAIDNDPALIEVARRRALSADGRRIFFKCEDLEALSFGDEVFDLVVGNLALGGLAHPEVGLAEVHRVLTRPGRLILTHALEGTFEEIFDMFREIALKRDDKDLLARTERIAGRYPSAAVLEATVRAAGFEDVEVRTEDLQLAFGRAADVFTDQAMRFVGLAEWRWIAGFEQDSVQIFDQVQRSLDTYFGGGPLSLSVKAGRVVARV